MRITHKHILGYLTTKFNIHIVWYFATQSNNRRGKICSPKNLLIFLVLHFSMPPAATYYPTKISESGMWMRFSSGWLDVTAPTLMGYMHNTTTTTTTTTTTHANLSLTLSPRLANLAQLNRYHSNWNILLHVIWVSTLLRNNVLL